MALLGVTGFPDIVVYSWQAGDFVEEPAVPKPASPVSIKAQDLTEQPPPDGSWKGKGSMPPLQRADSVKQRTIQVGLFIEGQRTILTGPCSQATWHAHGQTPPT